MAKKTKPEETSEKPSKPSTKLSIEAICNAINKTDIIKGVGGELTCRSGGNTMSRFSTGCKELDYALSGGYARGRIYELFGPESGGKTTVCLATVASYQNTYQDQIAAYIDSERTYDEDYARTLGVDTDRLIVSQPEGGEQALNVMMLLLEQGVSLIILDSVAALTTKDERNGAIGDVNVGGQARMMSQAMRKLVALIGTKKATVIFTNQLREKIGVKFGNPETTTGGKALRFYASARIRISKTSAIKEHVGDEDIVVSNEVLADVVKCKIGVPHRKARFHITFGIGIDTAFSLYNRSISAGVLIKKGSWFSVGDALVAQGTKKVVEMIRSDKAFSNKLEDLVSSSSIKVPVLDVEEGSADEKEDSGEVFEV
jgi:recombination protein RecA